MTWRQNLTFFRVVLAGGCLLCAFGAEANILNETFDTFSPVNQRLYQTRDCDYLAVHGGLMLSYTSLTKSPPNGIECILPRVSNEPLEREITLHFGGGGIASHGIADGGIYLLYFSACV